MSHINNASLLGRTRLSPNRRPSTKKESRRRKLRHRGRSRTVRFLVVCSQRTLATSLRWSPAPRLRLDNPNQLYLSPPRVEKRLQFETGGSYSCVSQSNVYLCTIASLPTSGHKSDLTATRRTSTSVFMFCAGFLWTLCTGFVQILHNTCCSWLTPNGKKGGFSSSPSPCVRRLWCYPIWKETPFCVLPDLLSFYVSFCGICSVCWPRFNRIILPFSLDL